MRIVLDNHPRAGWNGQMGAQFTRQKLTIDGEEALMAPTDTERYSLFALQTKQFGPVTTKLFTRIDHQDTSVDSDQKNFNGRPILLQVKALGNLHQIITFHLVMTN